MVFSRDAGRALGEVDQARMRLGEASGDILGERVHGVEGVLTALRSLEVMGSEEDDTELSMLSVFLCMK